MIKKLVEKVRRVGNSVVGYRSLVLGKRKSETIFLLSASLGDVVFGMSYISAYKHMHPEKNVKLIADKNTQFIVEAYSGYDKVLYFDKNDKFWKIYLKDLNASRYYAIKGQRMGIINTIPWVKHGFRQGYCLDLLRKDYSVGEDCPIQIPCPKWEKKILSIENFEEKKGKVIVINPYAHNNEDCDWEETLVEITKWLNGKGYVVYCNVIGKQKLINGTIPLRCGIDEFYKISDSIPLVISVRTGLMDWVNSTASSKVIIYTDEFDQYFRRFYSMKQWKRDNIYEFLLNRDRDKIFDTIKSVLRV